MLITHEYLHFFLHEMILHEMILHEMILYEIQNKK